jgi:DNA-binding CsgD family transcriptional regulator
MMQPSCQAAELAGSVPFASPADARPPELARHGAELGLLASTFISSYVRVTARVDIGEAFSLTRREAECLRWAAVGKTDAEIAEIISRTHGTVRYHLQKSGTKLRAVTRTQAVFKAAQLGYLGQLG